MLIQAFQKLIFFISEKDNKGLWHASIIDSYLVDFYIPFLPLEKPHVAECVNAEFSKYKFMIGRPALADVDEIVEDMVYEQAGFSKFSSSGCKRVPSLVRNLIVQKSYQLREEL